MVSKLFRAYDSGLNKLQVAANAKRSGKRTHDSFKCRLTQFEISSALS